MDTAVVAWCSG